MHKLASYAIMIICILVIYPEQNITTWNDKKIYFNVRAKADKFNLLCRVKSGEKEKPKMYLKNRYAQKYQLTGQESMEWVLH